MTGTVDTTAPARRPSPVLSAARVAWSSMRAALLAEFDRRGSFIAQMVFMMINDLVWVTFWLLVFSHKQSIRGWELPDVMVLFAVVTFSAGAALGLFNGVRKMSYSIRDGTIDPLLAQPQPVLVRILFGRIHPTFLGDMLFGPILFALSGHASAETWPRYLLAAALGALLLTAFIVIVESTAFWTSSGGEFANLAFGAMTVLAMYPASIFGGLAKVLVFTVLPAAFMSTVPASFVLDPSWRLLGMMFLSVLIAWTIAIVVFNTGVRRYMRDSA